MRTCSGFKGKERWTTLCFELESDFKKNWGYKYENDSANKNILRNKGNEWKTIFFQCSFSKRLQKLYDSEVGVGSGGSIDGVDGVGRVGSVCILVVVCKNKRTELTINTLRTLMVQERYLGKKNLVNYCKSSTKNKKNTWDETVL